MIGEQKSTLTPCNTHQNHQIGVFLTWGIPKSPWVSILKWSFMTWMVSGDPHDETETFKSQFKSHQSWLDIFNGHATGTGWLEVPTIYKAYFSSLISGNIPTKYSLIWNYHWSSPFRREFCPSAPEERLKQPPRPTLPTSSFPERRRRVDPHHLHLPSNGSISMWNCDPKLQLIV